MALCVFDLDHTLIQTPLDLAAMAVDMRALIEQANGPLPARKERYRVGEIDGGFLHFHEHGTDELYADIKTGVKFELFPANTAAERKVIRERTAKAIAAASKP